MEIIREEGLMRCTGEFPIVRLVEGASPEPGVVWVGPSELDLVVAGSEASTPAVCLGITCSGQDSGGVFFRDFELAMPPHAARALARRLLRQAAVAERAGALPWVAGELPGSDPPRGFALRLVPEGKEASPARAPRSRVRAKAVAQPV